MFLKIKHRLFIVIFTLLWIRLLLMTADPQLGDATIQGWPMYSGDRQFINLLYAISGIFVWPVDQLYRMLDPYLPDVSWFPQLPSPGIRRWYQHWAEVSTAEHLIRYGQMPSTMKTLAGTVDLMTVAAMFVYAGLYPALDWAYEELRVLYWKFLIKVPVTKNARDLQEYERKAARMMDKNRKYQQMGKGTNLITASVVTDELTQTYNKRFFVQKLGQAFHDAKNNGTALAVALMEIDHFNDIAQEEGFPMAERVIQAMADAAREHTPEGCYLCRSETHQFALIMPGKSSQEAYDTVNEIHQYFQVLRYQENPDLRSTASIGLIAADFGAESRPAWQSFNEMLKFAEDELRLARGNGRNRIEARKFPA